VDKLRKRLNELIVLRLDDAGKFMAELEHLASVHPFNKYEYIISTLLAADKLSLDEYHQLRAEHAARNRYLHLFEISAPRGFGEGWAHGHLKALVPDLVKPSRKQDPRYAGEYDFILDGKIRIEVKASRAVDFESREPLYAKALSSDSGKQFDMNFQQIKPACCDAFVWIAVWRDLIRYWVLASREVEENRYFSKGQHRGNVGEGQLHLNRDNIQEFAEYEVEPDHLLRGIRQAYQRQTAR